MAMLGEYEPVIGIGAGVGVATDSLVENPNSVRNFAAAALNPSIGILPSVAIYVALVLLVGDVASSRVNV